MSNTQTSLDLAEDEIDLRELVLALWGKRRIIVASSLAGLVLASIYAFVIAKPVYESSALLLPTQSSSTTDMGAAAALLGKKSTNAGDVDLYQSLLSSRTVIHKLLHAPIRNGSDTGKGRTEPLFIMLKIDSESPKEIDAFVKGISKSIVVGSKDNSTSGILEIKFRAGAPWLAQQIGTTILDIGQEELRLVRINRSSIILNRLSIAVAQSRNEWDTTTQAFTLYKDRNRSILLPEQQLELSRLEMEKSAKEQKYLLARKEYEIQLLEQAKAAPPMMILDPANLPYRMISPKRKIIISIGLFASLFISVSTITIRILFSKIIANLIKKP